MNSACYPTRVFAWFSSDSCHAVISHLDRLSLDCAERSCISKVDSHCIEQHAALNAGIVCSHRSATAVRVTAHRAAGKLGRHNTRRAHNF